MSGHKIVVSIIKFYKNLYIFAATPFQCTFVGAKKANIFLEFKLISNLQNFYQENTTQLIYFVMIHKLCLPMDS